MSFNWKLKVPKITFYEIYYCLLYLMQYNKSQYHFFPFNIMCILYAKKYCSMYKNLKNVKLIS